MNRKKLKKGDTVIMKNCIEAREHKLHIWTCTCNEFTRDNQDLVFLDDFSGTYLEDFIGAFRVKYLKKVKEVK